MKAPAELRARVMAAVQAEPSLARGPYRARTALLAGASLALGIAFFLAKGGVKRGDRDDLLLFGTAAAWALIAVLVTALGSRPARSMLGRPRPVLVTALVVTAPALAVSALALALADGPRADPAMHLACGVLTIAQGLLPLTALILFRRAGDPLAPALTGAALGLAAGTWSALMAHLRCPYVGLPHVLLAHVLPVLALAAAGAVVGVVALRVRATPR